MIGNITFRGTEAPVCENCKTCENCEKPAAPIKVEEKAPIAVETAQVNLTEGTKPEGVGEKLDVTQKA